MSNTSNASYLLYLLYKSNSKHSRQSTNRKTNHHGLTPQRPAHTKQLELTAHSPFAKSKRNLCRTARQQKRTNSNDVPAIENVFVFRIVGDDLNIQSVNWIMNELIGVSREPVRNLDERATLLKGVCVLFGGMWIVRFCLMIQICFLCL